MSYISPDVNVCRTIKGEIRAYCSALFALGSGVGLILEFIISSTLETEELGQLWVWGS